MCEWIYASSRSCPRTSRCRRKPCVCTVYSYIGWYGHDIKFSTINATKENTSGHRMLYQKDCPPKMFLLAPKRLGDFGSRNLSRHGTNSIKYAGQMNHSQFAIQMSVSMAVVGAALQISRAQQLQVGYMRLYEARELACQNYFIPGYR
ncbi:hypothetical protein BDR05DRAFT_165942 [Suillus weaverae]|nr:hypothetical protein BDR05DRAFT_165942 [Suillus weaverae]